MPQDAVKSADSFGGPVPNRAGARAVCDSAESNNPPWKADHRAIARKGAPWPHSRKWWVCTAIALLFACTGLFVLSDVAQNHYFPHLSVAWRHFLLTIRAAVVTTAGCAVTYWIMYRGQQRIERTADELAARLESYRGDVGERAAAAVRRKGA